MSAPEDRAMRVLSWLDSQLAAVIEGLKQGNLGPLFDLINQVQTRGSEVEEAFRTALRPEMPSIIDVVKQLIVEAASRGFSGRWCYVNPQIDENQLFEEKRKWDELSEDERSVIAAKVLGRIVETARQDPAAGVQALLEFSYSPLGVLVYAHIFRDEYRDVGVSIIDKVVGLLNAFGSTECS